MSVTVQPYEPTILALSPAPLPSIALSVPEHVLRGGDLRCSIQPDRISTADLHVLRFEIRDSSGKLVRAYSGNLRAAGAHASRTVPIATNDPAGRWEIRVHDMLSGGEASAPVQVE